MTILISNDDGYDAPGLKALEEELSRLGRVVVVAPDREQSGAAHSLTLNHPLRVRSMGENRYRVEGTPTDCVNLAIFQLLKDGRPDLVVSGINRGYNLGDDVTYSGTVAAALEGVLLEIPSFAISLCSRGQVDFGPAARVAGQVARLVLAQGLPRDTLLNINVPPGDPKCASRGKAGGCTPRAWWSAPTRKAGRTTGSGVHRRPGIRIRTVTSPRWSAARCP